MAGRDASGRFVKGEYKGGPGRPARKVEDAVQDAMIRVATERADAIASKLAELAAAGDVSAARLLLEYTARKPLPELSAGEVALLSRINAVVIERGVTLDKVLQDVLQQITSGEVPESSDDGL